MSSFLTAGRAAPRIAPSFIKKGAKRKGKNQKTTKFEAPLGQGSLKFTYFGGMIKQWKMYGKFNGKVHLHSAIVWLGNMTPVEMS